MGKTLRQRVRALTRSADEKALISQGFTYASGALTKEGRKVVLDHIFHNTPEVKDAIVEKAKALDEADKKKKT